MGAQSVMKIENQSLAAQLERDGIVVLPDFIQGEQLKEMQKAFQIMLRRMKWNDFPGYEKTEPYRHMVQDVLTLEQGFVDLAIHPIVKDTLSEYIGDDFALVEAKGWLSNPTTKDFNGWHGDCWYDQKTVKGTPREVKLAFYLTDVSSGAFNYLKGTHGKAPRARVPNSEAETLIAAGTELIKVTGKAGTAVMFDTSGTHRQGVPILQHRQAVFYNYHSPNVALQEEDIAYYRYHPLLLNAAFLGGLSEEDRKILGFGVKSQYLKNYERKPKHLGFQKFVSTTFNAKLRWDEQYARVSAKIRKTLSAR